MKSFSRDKDSRKIDTNLCMSKIHYEINSVSRKNRLYLGILMYIYSRIIIKEWIF